MKIYKKNHCEATYFLVTDTTLKSENPSCFRKDLLGIIQKLIMIIDDKT